MLLFCWNWEDTRTEECPFVDLLGVHGILNQTLEKMVIPSNESYFEGYKMRIPKTQLYSVSPVTS